ncbi:transcription elongation factor GreA [bacterium]|nr:MAG: transcription elongation factor GreA [bacterium]
MDKSKKLTREEFNNLTKELEDLKTNKRSEVALRLRDAKAQGDLSENAEYSEAREAQSFLENRIQTIENTIASSEVVDTSGQNPDAVAIGMTVVIDMDGVEQKFEIVGGESADPAQSRISIASPLGEALKGMRTGESTTFQSPKGEIGIRIKNISC